jgi:uncharacterized protein (TIGR02145 family)
MAENLRYLPAVSAPSVASNTVPYYYVYGYKDSVVTQAKDSVNYSVYGVLYNWPAAMNGEISSTSNPSDVQGVCPAGWHLPSEAEWIQLANYLGGTSVAGGKLKEVGTTHWGSFNYLASNSSGFTALPGGGCVSGYFQSKGSFANFWSATEASSTNAKYMYLRYDAEYISITNSSKNLGLSVRCLKD